MKPVIELGPGAERNPAAARLAAVLAANLRQPGCGRAIGRLGGTVCFVVDDLGVALTLRFDYGHITLYDDLVGVPDLTLRGDAATLARLHELPRGLGWLRGLMRSGSNPRRALSRLAGELRGGRLKAYGALQHPRLLVGLLAVLSSAPEGRARANDARSLDGCSADR